MSTDVVAAIIFIIGSFVLGFVIGGAVASNNQTISNKVVDKIRPWWKRIFDKED
jgi:hypothetical protein